MEAAVHRREREDGSGGRLVREGKSELDAGCTRGKERAEQKGGSGTGRVELVNTVKKYQSYF